MNKNKNRPGWDEEYADYAGVEKRQYERYRQSCGLSALCWVAAALILVMALAVRVY